MTLFRGACFLGKIWRGCRVNRVATVGVLEYIWQKGSGVLCFRARVSLVLSAEQCRVPKTLGFVGILRSGVLARTGFHLGVWIVATVTTIIMATQVYINNRTSHHDFHHHHNHCQHTCNIRAASYTNTDDKCYDCMVMVMIVIMVAIMIVMVNMMMVMMIVVIMMTKMKHDKGDYGL